MGYPCHFEHLYVFARSFRKLDIMLFLKYQFPCFLTQFRLVFNFPSAQIPSIRSLLYLTLVLMPWCFFTRYAQTSTGHPGCHNRAAAFLPMRRGIHVRSGAREESLQWIWDLTSTVSGPQVPNRFGMITEVLGRSWVSGKSLEISREKNLGGWNTTKKRGGGKEEGGKRETKEMYCSW